MAHSLPGARSILTLRSTRRKNSQLASNIRWSYANSTIPRHLRDVVVTEYGVADLRGLSDQDVIAALLNIADSRFQDGLKREAQAAGKLARDYQIPDRHRNNMPRALDERFILARARGLFSEFPFGTALRARKSWLAKALSSNQGQGFRRLARVKTLVSAAASRGIPAGTRQYLERMSLLAPKSRREWLWQRLLVQELRDIAMASRPDCFLDARVSNLAIPAYPAERLMKIGVPKEIKIHEYRVGLVPAGVRELVDSGHQVVVQSGGWRGNRIRGFALPSSGARRSPKESRNFSARPTSS